MNKRLVLEPNEKDSALWIKIRTEFERRIDEYRKGNDKFNLNELETARLRARIAELKSLIELQGVSVWKD